MTLQQGIYWDKQRTPPRCWSATFLRVSEGTDATVVDAVMRELWTMWQALMAGKTRDLPGQDVGASDLEVLVGYGINAFHLAGVRRTLPSAFGKQHFKQPGPGGTAILPRSPIRYASDLTKNPATEDVMVQGTAATPLAAARLVVETEKLIADLATSGAPPALQVVSAFTGFNREDHRSWIDFHDGTSNLVSGRDRLDAIAIKPSPEVGPDDAWTVGGTYLAFMRLAVDLPGWRTLRASEQELAVGRNKLTGCPLLDVAADGTPRMAEGCPAAGTSNVHEDGNAAFFEPDTPFKSTEATHVQRANHHMPLPLTRVDSFRIFRQGYEFFEAPRLDRPTQLGLNFVSFQDTPERLFHILMAPTWLADVNFGGPVDAQKRGLADLITCHAAAIYLVPPLVAEEVYPGQGIFHA